ncbi:hypothetical protein CORMATOL_00224 [Corynebacterium matruchotii ATCC 33806]|uniref:Uncharacterized protein n=1 Tax=Corynebacterium matruchotii ATCC 33806 TaxID=566549 RepID=C0DZS8_9CORY|nr:hypothetical protein CORMATOL_00224 [Corynebacterium matruchotii ATCC 33806]
MVFSAHAEVVPSIGHTLQTHLGILRARGGSSTIESPGESTVRYSPRTRR